MYRSSLGRSGKPSHHSSNFTPCQNGLLYSMGKSLNALSFLDHCASNLNWVMSVSKQHSMAVKLTQTRERAIKDLVIPAQVGF